jgi:maltodextrin utilization protein YvdJ
MRLAVILIGRFLLYTKCSDNLMFASFTQANGLRLNATFFSPHFTKRSVSAEVGIGVSIAE